jgi:hypothetical protein
MLSNLLTVDGQALEKLQDSFDTTELLRAVDAIDQVRYRDDDLRQDMLNLHGMAHLEQAYEAESGGNQGAW